MATKAQHYTRYAPIPGFLRVLREEAGLTQRDFGTILHRPQSWVYKSETGNRRVDIAEFHDWCRACKIPFAKATFRLERILG
ncbi:MAG: helix-turn-helix transcriptional regulator [Tepidisphaeraceae bacterium]